MKRCQVWWRSTFCLFTYVLSRLEGPDLWMNHKTYTGYLKGVGLATKSFFFLATGYNCIWENDTTLTGLEISHYANNKQG